VNPVEEGPETIHEPDNDSNKRNSKSTITAQTQGSIILKSSKSITNLVHNAYQYYIILLQSGIHDTYPATKNEALSIILTNHPEIMNDSREAAAGEESSMTITNLVYQSALK
jgi:hypothetical protein